MLRIGYEYISTAEAAGILVITPLAASRLVRQAKIPGIKIAGVYLVSRVAVQEFAKGYAPLRGRPKKKRKYTKRSPKWNTE